LPVTLLKVWEKIDVPSTVTLKTIRTAASIAVPRVEDREHEFEVDAVVGREPAERQRRGAGRIARARVAQELTVDEGRNPIAAEAVGIIEVFAEQPVARTPV